MKRSSLVLLILCSLVWTFNPMMGKTLLRSYDGLQVAWIRYFGGFLSFALVAGLSVSLDRRSKWSDYFFIPSDLRTWLEIFALGLGPFVYSPILQFIGLETAQAMDSSILIATEPLITVLLARLVLGERMTRDHVIAMAVALVGFFFFSGLFDGVFGSGVKFSISVGMILLLFSLVGEAGFSVFSRKLVQFHSPTAVLGSALAIAALTLTLIVICFDSLPMPGSASAAQLGAAIWLGPIGSTLTYLIWARIARSVSVATMVITLFVQPVVGAVVGYSLLGESLTPVRFLGATLILAAIAFLSYREVRRGSVV